MNKNAIINLERLQQFKELADQKYAKSEELASLSGRVKDLEDNALPFSVVNGEICITFNE